ncbi:response regulator transcription factor [Tamlana fucoidanivorans]|uniref:Response regulator transcription factor n=1 Tax=Allotamlana fucoidanivorans TaxID=2583814 RepID=A0A5C4SNY2_9FLAO|nr:LytTR family DNA-binding domain-containing protein [Tamlana fucoidanivorans]TNJ45192.1 response regulator transcription factor [Tamlana fucoidanivorans]
MKVVIVEDEIAASENLTYLINSIDSNIEIVKVLDSVKASVAFFATKPQVDLVFMDIHLADGISFEIFDQITLNLPVVFTTAYDQYAMKAFKVNSIDYLLKPISEEDLSEAINQFKAQQKQEATLDESQIRGIMQLIQSKNKTYKSTYLVHHRDELVPLKTEDIAYFYIETGIVKAVTNTNKPYIIDKKLEDIENELDPEYFHRINRQFVVNKNAVVNIKFYFNGKLILNVNPSFKERIVVSKAKASEVKNWMNM